MTERDRYDGVVRELIGPRPRTAGYRRVRNRFARRDEEARQIIDFQASQFGSVDSVQFTVNLAVALLLETRSSMDRLRQLAPGAPEERDRLAVLLAQSDRTGGP